LNLLLSLLFELTLICIN